MDIFSETFSNSWFSATFLWRTDTLIRIDLTDQVRPATEARSSFGPELASIIANFSRLDQDVWPDLPLETTGLPPFTLKVLHHLRQHTPRGTWTTYGQLAAACGSPRGARAVGAVMARNPWPLLFPCHRVLAANQGLGGFGPGLALKKALLALEKATLS